MNLHIMFGLTAAAAALLPLAAGADNITELALAIGGSKSVACPTGMSLIEAAANWDNDFNSDAGGDFVYLCAGTGGTKPPITALSAAATASAKSSGACPAGYEQLPGNMNQGSTKDTGFLYLCASRDRNAGPALSRIVGEPTDACPGKLSAVSGTGGAPATPFNFDAAGQGVVLCTGHSVLIKPATTLALAIGASSVACPAGTSRIEAGAGWDADFNSGSGGKYVYLCVGRGGSNGPITAITAVTSATAKLSGACPVGYEQLAGNANDGSKNTGFLYVCVSRGAGTAITRLIGEAASTACPRGMSAVRSASAPFNFDPAGSNVFLCTGQAPKPCPPGPSPGPAAGPVTALSLMIGTSSDSQICCPAGWQRITDGDDSPSPQTRWDGNFNSGAGGDTVVLCAGRSGELTPITALQAFSTPSDADPYGDCPTGYTKVTGNSTNPRHDLPQNNMNSDSRNTGDMYLCLMRKPDAAPIRSLSGGKHVPNSSACPPGLTAVPGTPALPGPFDFDPAGGGLHLCMNVTATGRQ